MSGAMVHRVEASGPGDVSGLSQLNAHGTRAESVRAVIGKTEGNGCVNDFSRDLASRAWSDALPSGAVTVMSGGTEGVLSPHFTLISEDGGGLASPSTLRVGVAVTDAIAPAELGRRAQVDAVAAAVTRARHSAGVDVQDVHFVLVKCPLLTSGAIDATHRRGESVVCTGTYESMAHSRGAASLGVALALEEIADGVVQPALDGTVEAWSSVASASAGVEVRGCHVVLLGNAVEQPRGQRICSTVMQDAVDAASVQHLLNMIAAEGGRIVQVFAKAEADETGTIRGRRHTMLTDSDVASTRHARAAVGGLLSGLTGDTALYVSGGAEHQGPAGGGPVAIVWEPGNGGDA